MGKGVSIILPSVAPPTNSFHSPLLRNPTVNIIPNAGRRLFWKKKNNEKKRNKKRKRKYRVRNKPIYHCLFSPLLPETTLQRERYSGSSTVQQLELTLGGIIEHHPVTSYGIFSIIIAHYHSALTQRGASSSHCIWTIPFLLLLSSNLRCSTFRVSWRSVLGPEPWDFSLFFYSIYFIYFILSNYLGFFPICPSACLSRKGKPKSLIRWNRALVPYVTDLWWKFTLQPNNNPIRCAWELPVPFLPLGSWADGQYFIT